MNLYTMVYWRVKIILRHYPKGPTLDIRSMNQLIASFKTQMPQVPEAFWTKFQQKMDTRELINKIIPIYDKYYTIEDLKAVNAFYETPAGQKVLSTLPQIMQESMKVGQEWGQKMGKQAADEAEQEMKKPQS